MSICSELLILLPCHDLDDLPGRAREGAAGVLAAWTAAWHPALLAHFRRLPLWYSADAPPEADPHRAAIIPEISLPLLPTSWTSRLPTAPEAMQSDVVMATGNETRRALVEKLLGSPPTGDTWENDFFALGFTMLQVQTMTRRLRYSSNLDENYLSQRALAAADAACSGDETAARHALQECFDLLAQERDHYFSGNPLLLDLTLVPPADSEKGFSDSTLRSLAITLRDPDPVNLLLSADQIEHLTRQAPELVEQLRQRITDQTADVAGGWLDRAPEIHALTARSTVATLQHARELSVQFLGRAPRVFARLNGGVPHDFLAPLVEQGYRGAIIADFVGGRDSGQSEPKLNWQAGTLKLEAITARPIDATKAVDLMEVAPRLGEAMDAGNVPTALLAHWPGCVSDTYSDLRVAARWGLALGKFVTLTQYFEQSARSYHSFKPATPRPAWDWLRLAASSASSVLGPSGSEDPMQVARGVFCQSVQEETQQVAKALTQWVLGSEVTTSTRKDAALVNPYLSASRASVTLDHWPATHRPKTILGSTADARRGSKVRVEVAGCGFVSLGEGPRPRRSWFRRERRLADSSSTLRNATMSAEIDTKRGSIHGVYTLGVRGNRLSLRLAAFDATDALNPYSTMIADRTRVLRSDTIAGEIEVSGRCVRGDRLEAEFVLVYRLELGSRCLQIEGQINSFLQPLDDPFKRYLAFRAAVTDASVVPQLLVRDRRMPASGRRYAAPLGVHLDLASHSITICSGGHAVHRRAEDAIFDTLVATRPGKQSFRLAYGFDLKQPLQEAKSWIAPPVEVSPVEPRAAQTLKGQGYFLHCQPASLALVDASVVPNDPSSIDLTFVETEGRARQCRVASCVALKHAAQLHGAFRTGSTSDSNESSTATALTIDKDTVTFEIPSHGVTILRLTRLAP